MNEPWPFRSAVVVVLAALTAPSAVARADDSAAARKDFRTGLSLLRLHEGVAACRMFERSYLEEAAPGTLYNLSLCREQQGRLDEAYRGFVELTAVAEQARDTAKAEVVKRKAVALQARLARLDLSRRQDVPSAITGLSLDDTVLANEAWKAPVYVMPGTHRLSIRHDDGITVTRTTDALQAGQTQSLVLDDASEVAPPPAPPASASKVDAEATTPATRTAAYATGGAAVALVGAGAVLGLLAISRKHAADEACSGGAPASSGGTATCSSDAAAATATHDIGTAHTESTLSTVGFAVGAGAAAVAGVLFFVSRPSSSAPASDALRASFVVDPHAGALTLTGRF